MPAISHNQLIDAVIDAAYQSGGTAIYIFESKIINPRKFAINHAGNRYELWVYLWSLTPGGRPSLRNEYRIQMTSVSSPLPLNPNGSTVLLGYYSDLGIFAGFDLSKHTTFTQGSPSVQIKFTAITDALQNGLSFARKDNDEIAIGIRPDQFLNYCFNAESLHRHGADSQITNLLAQAVEQQEIPEQDIEALTADRKQIIENVRRYSRDARFRKIVLTAYDHRCAVTKIQLKLVEAAHILPVPSRDSSDHVTNGIALSPTFHKAFDSCLVYLDTDYIMRLNTKKADEMKNSRLDGGLQQISDFLDQKIYLPPDAAQRPRIEYIKRANQYRRIPGW